MSRNKRSPRVKEVHRHKMKKRIRRSTLMEDIFRTVLLSAFITLVIFMSILGFYMYSRNVKYAISLLETESSSASVTAEHYFSDQITILDVLSYSPCLVEANTSLEKRALLVSTIKKIESANEQINKIFLGYEDDIFLLNEGLEEISHRGASWYSQAIESSQESAYSVNLVRLNKGDSPKFILSKAIYKDKEKIGVVGIDCDITELYDLLERESMYLSKESILINVRNKVILTENPQKVYLDLINSKREIFHNETANFKYNHKGKNYLIITKLLVDEEWLLITKVDYAEVTGSVLPRLSILVAILIILTLIISKIYAKILGNTIAKPVIEISSALHSLAQGSRKVNPIREYPKNEIGIMAKSFNAFWDVRNSLESDISELEEMKADLSYSLSLLNASLESTEDGILIINSDGYINKWNHKFLEIWGINESDLAIRTDAKLLPDIEDKVLDYKAFMDTIKETIKNPDMISFDVIKLTNNKIIERYSFPQEVEGKIVGRVWRYRDITQLHLSEIRLKDSEEKHRVMFTQTVDAYCILDNGVFVDVNQAASDMLGAPKEWLVGKTPFDISPEKQANGKDSLEEGQKYIDYAMKHGRCSFHWIHKRKDGREFPAEISLIKIQLKAKDVILAIWRDITEEKEMAEKLRTSEENFRLFFETLQDMVFIADFSGKIEYTNKAVVAKLGYNADELREMTILDLHENNENYKLEDVVDYLINNKENVCPLPLLSKDGLLIPVETQSWVGKWNGKESLFAVSKDISKEQEALEKFNKIFDSNPALMALSSYPERRFLDVNEAFCKTLGYEKENIIGKTTRELNLTMEMAKLDLASAKLVSQGNFKNIHLKVTPANGEIIEGLFSGELIESNGKKYFLTVMTDITDMQKLDRKLRESEKKYRLLFENMTTGFALHEMIYDEMGNPIDYIFLDINPAFESFTGLKAKDIVGKRVKEVLPNTEDYWIETYGKVAKTRQSINYEDFSQAFDKYFEVRAFSPEKDKFAVIFSDSTERVKALKELEKEKELAQAATKAKSEFLANMSHEIRTPLNGVIGFTDLLLSTQLDESQKQFAINANVSGKALLGIISDILDFSKIEAGKMELDIVKASVSEIMEEAVDIVKFAACKKNLEILLNIPTDFPDQAMVDPLRLKQILLNLLNNAVKFTAKGEIELSANFLAQNEKAGRFIFSVRDTGIGISEEASKRLFKAFSQADGSITRRYGGTGLGLVISNYFATQMGSHIDFISDDGKGSEFYFAIDTDYVEKSHVRRGKLAGKRILISDLNDKYRDILRTRLEYWGALVKDCNCFDSINTEITKDYYDVAIIDERILTADGFSDLAKKLGAKLNSKETTLVISYCPNDNVEIINLSKGINADHIITKPLIISELFSLLDSICNNEKVKSKVEKQVQQSINKYISQKIVTILIAEDVDMNMSLIRTLVKKLVPNAIIKEAKNGMEAVVTYKKEEPDLVLMDIQMPELDGLEATKTIKKLERNKEKNTPIIALTAGAFSDDREKCLNAGMVGFLTKPINVKDLTEVLKEFI